jgi:iron complex outermembrane receptor protein
LRRFRTTRIPRREFGLAAVSALALAGAAVPALAQDGADDRSARAPSSNGGSEFDETEVDELVVTAGRVAPRGSVAGDIPPEITLTPRDIRAAGVSSVSELLDYLAPQIASGRGRGDGHPVTLVNGARVSSFREIRDIPAEAIVRVEILPEEVSLKYGYRADQRVVNFVLRRRFNATTAEGGVKAPTEGGQGTQDAAVTHFRIQKDTRFQLGLKASRQTALLESERDLVRDPDEGPVNEGPYRTLSPATETGSINAVVTRTLGEGVSATLNGSLEAQNSRSRLGLAQSSLTVPASSPFATAGGDTVLQVYPNGLDPTRRTTDTLTGHLGGVVNWAAAGWRWSVTGNADRTLTRSLTDSSVDISALQAAVNAGDPSVNPFGAIPTDLLRYGPADRTRSVVTSADADLVASGTLFKVPAGDAAATFKVGFETRDIDSDTFRRAVSRSTDLSRDAGSAQASFDLPIASRRKGVLQPLGDLSVNANAAVDRLSDFGTLTTYGFGANWSPVQPLRLIASFTAEDGAPTIQQLGDPEGVTPGVRVFDYVRGETVEVTQVSGGNAALAADSRKVMKLGLTFNPFKETNLTFRADYVRTRIRDAIATFPTATAEVEAAFPERFVRGADGRLALVDIRPVNFEREDRDQLRWGFNFTKPIGPQPPRRGPDGWRPGDGPPPGDGPGARRGDGPGGGRWGGPGGGGGGRGFGGPRGGGALQFALFHTWTFKDEILIRDGVPVLDLLDGSAAGSSGGAPRHQVDLQAGVTKNGIGARLEGQWKSATEVRGGAFGGEDLDFSDLTTVGLRVFADLGRQPFARNNPWLRGARASLSVENLFNQRQKVRAADGTTPINYQPDYLDPQGRTVRISFRKVFF